MNDYDIRDGRTHMYFQGDPLYPFGYGLSYTKFEYRNLTVSSTKIAAGGAITVSLDVKNTGQRRGDEVVQLYVRAVNSQPGRPKQKLRGFQRITLEPDESRSVQFLLREDALASWNEQQHRFAERAGPIELLIGSSSVDIRVRQRLTRGPAAGFVAR